jgi:cardiolipin synthase
MPFETDPDQALSLSWYAQRKPVFTGGNRVELLRGATEMFPAQIRAIDAAHRSVWMATYLVSERGASSLVLAALSRAARRGVAVHLVVDGVGSRDVSGQIWQDLRETGVEVAVYRPLGRWWSLLWDRTHWRRMHVKLCVIDDNLAFTGGINLIDDHYDLGHGWSPQPRLDYGVQFSGPSVTPALHTVRAMWTRATLGRDWRDDITEWMLDPARVKRLRQVWQEARLRLTPTEQQRVVKNTSVYSPMRAAFVLRDNLRQRRTIERAAQQAIIQARSRVDIATPYFYPGRLLQKALRQAAQRGVRVNLLLQGKPDYRIAAIAARVLYDELQRCGVRIFEYQTALLHAKVLCVDEEWATIGSSNLDPLSLMMNLEANLIVRDRGFARAVSKALALDFANSREVPHPKQLGSSMGARLTRTMVAWCAKTYLRLAGVARRR